MGANVSTSIQSFRNSLDEEVNQSCQTNVVCKQDVVKNTYNIERSGCIGGPEALIIEQTCYGGADCGIGMVARSVFKALQSVEKQQQLKWVPGLNVSSTKQEQIQEIKRRINQSCATSAQAEQTIRDNVVNVKCVFDGGTCGTCFKQRQYAKLEAKCAINAVLNSITEMGAKLKEQQTGTNALMWVLLGLGAVAIIGGIVYYSQSRKAQQRQAAYQRGAVARQQQQRAIAAKKAAETKKSEEEKKMMMMLALGGRTPPPRQPAAVTPIIVQPAAQSPGTATVMPQTSPGTAPTVTPASASLW